MPGLNGNEKVTCENCEAQIRRRKIVRQKRDVQLKHFIVLNVPTSQRVLTLISTFILEKSRVYPTQTKFTSVNFVIKFLPVFIPSDYIDRRCSTRKMYWRPKMWV